MKAFRSVLVLATAAATTAAALTACSSPNPSGSPSASAEQPSPSTTEPSPAPSPSTSVQPTPPSPSPSDSLSALTPLPENLATAIATVTAEIGPVLGYSQQGNGDWLFTAVGSDGAAVDAPVSKDGTLIYTQESAAEVTNVPTLVDATGTCTAEYASRVAITAQPGTLIGAAVGSDGDNIDWLVTIADSAGTRSSVTVDTVTCLIPH